MRIHYGKVLLKFPIVLALVLLVAGATFAHAVSYSLGTGTFEYTELTGQTTQCLGGSYTQTTFYPFSYVDAGKTYTIPWGTATYNSVSTADPGGCPPAGPEPASESYTLPVGVGGTATQTCTITWTPESNPTISCTSPPVSYQGYVNLKYLVVGVTYAPPGPSASTFVQYTNSTLVGTTMSLSNSFTSSFSNSVAVSTGFATIPKAFSGSITDTTTSTNSQTHTTGSTVSTSFQVQSGEKTSGTGNYYSPVDNDYDIIWIWLNPVVIATVTSNSVVWNGFGYNGSDQNGEDIVGIPLGYLNGHFGTMPPEYATPIARTWAKDQVFASGQVPGLTSTDLANIAKADPFSVSTYGADYIGSVPPSPNTKDNRFTISSCSAAQSFNYDQADPSAGADTYTCTLTYTNLTSATDTLSSTSTMMYSTDVELGASFLKIWTASIKITDTLTFSSTAQQTITSSTTKTQTAALSVQGPACNNTVAGKGPCVPVYDASGNQPTQFDVYQDNLYGTFMFAPIHYY